MNENNNATTTTTSTTTTKLTTTATTKDMNYRNPITESEEEEELLASSQETSKSTTGHTNQSIPVDTAVKAPDIRVEASTSKAAMSTNQSALAAKGENRKKRKKSQNQLRKNRYQRAGFILGKIAKDQAAGTPVDEAETKRLKSIVEEYEGYLKRKQSQPQEESKRESTSQKRNRSITEVPGTQPKKPRRSEGEHSSTTTARHFCDVARDSLQVAIIDGNSSSPSTMQERWVEIDVRLSSMVLSYVLDNPAGPHPEFDSSETLRGIKCRPRWIS
ncbi:myb-like protein X [Bactrocera neohumeralis]|uniref:myb-like protein X n=1 Tax=Bactrocera neohumeralis TaxID=98809 RepID=UPI0021658AED|nr:myb-like protein X [Bactrocera neohumeralis]